MSDEMDIVNDHLGGGDAWDADLDNTPQVEGEAPVSPSKSK